MRRITSESERKTRKSAAEKLRHAIKDLRSIGDHGTAERLAGIVKRLDERRALDNAAAGME